MDLTRRHQGVTVGFINPMVQDEKSVSGSDINLRDSADRGGV